MPRALPGGPLTVPGPGDMLRHMSRAARIARFARTWSPALLLGALYLQLVLPHGHDLAALIPDPDGSSRHAHHGHGPEGHPHREDAGAGQHHHELSAHSDTHHTGRQDRHGDEAPPPPALLIPAAAVIPAPDVDAASAPRREPPPPTAPRPTPAVRGPPAVA